MIIIVSLQNAKTITVWTVLTERWITPLIPEIIIVTAEWLKDGIGLREMQGSKWLLHAHQLIVVALLQQDG